MARIATKRLTKELAELQNGGCPTGSTLLKADDLQEWLISLEVLGDSVYVGERFCLKFKFSNDYPISAPEVTFSTTDGWKAPIHPHIYSNGHICASILGTDWSPVLNTSSIILTLQSMLASLGTTSGTGGTGSVEGGGGVKKGLDWEKKKRPEDDESYVKRAPLSPKQTRFVYHDDTV